MALYSCGRPGDFRFKAGAVLFNTENPPHHAAIILADKAGTHSDGRMTFHIAHMTDSDIYFDDQSDPMGLAGFVGHFTELSDGQYAVVLEALQELYHDPSPPGWKNKRKALYTFTNHGAKKPAPNAPGTFLPGIYCSCASLVEHCYAQIATRRGSFDLVRESAVPKMTEAEIWEIASPGSFLTEAARRLLRKSLDGSGPWSVLLPAYQMRAFELGLGALPYAPKREDHPFNPTQNAP